MKRGNVYDQTDDTDTPCGVCPWADFEVFDYNIWCYDHWKILDITGRDRGFGETPLREEAIDAHLRRYEANLPDIYETIIQIETILFGHRQEERDKEEKRKQKQADAVSHKTAPKRPSRGGGITKSVPQRLTAKIPRIK
tara:strand:- start:50 stop:466 length:417 start_codon:yes stop_codon:yes gene_type:complete